MVSPEQGKQELGLLVGFLSAYILRASTSFLEKWLIHNCQACTFGRSGSAVLAVERGMAWSEASDRLGGAQSEIVSLAACRLIFWHWLQPLCFAAIFYSWSKELSFLQLCLGCAVLARELLYFGCSLLALGLCPAYLLVDVMATWCSGARGETIAFVLMPEKFLGWYMLGQHPDSRAKKVYNIYFALVLLLDCCGLLALYAGYASWSPWPPLPIAACYGVNAVSALCLPIWATVLIIVQMNTRPPEELEQTLSPM